MNKKEYILNFETLRKILSKKSNELLDQFIEHIDCTCDNYSLMEICSAIDNYENTRYHELITSLSKDLKGYDVAYDDEDDLTYVGYDFIILFVQNEILETHRREYNMAVFGQESGTINF